MAAYEIQRLADIYASFLADIAAIFKSDYNADVLTERDNNYRGIKCYVPARLFCDKYTDDNYKLQISLVARTSYMGKPSNPTAVASILFYRVAFPYDDPAFEKLAELDPSYSFDYKLSQSTHSGLLYVNLGVEIFNALFAEYNSGVPSTNKASLAKKVAGSLKNRSATVATNAREIVSLYIKHLADKADGLED